MNARNDHITSLPPDGLTEGDATPGLTREVAFSTDRAIFVRAHCEGGVSSGWHDHGSREVHGHVMRGRVRFEYGPGGREHTEVEQGGYFHVPAGVIHRDVNPTDTPQDLIIAFVGEGPLVVNRDGPDPS
jgi:quercetin dioxygenase-like cupin family protein